MRPLHPGWGTDPLRSALRAPRLPASGRPREPRAATDRDDDGDGLTDAEEIDPPAGTPPTNPGARDSDGDGLYDAEEVTPGADGLTTNPTVADEDGDGVEDGKDAQPAQAIVYYHGDHLGSTTVVTNQEDKVVERALYQPYGEAVGGSPPEFGFTGQRFEADLGIYDYGARFYDPALGRFLSADSVVPEPGDPQSLNRYSYVRNNSLSRVDPSGNFDFDSAIETGSNFLSNPRTTGMLQAGGGLLEAGVGVGACYASAGLGCAAGALAFEQGVEDLFAGSRQLISGEPTNTLTYDLARSLGASPSVASGVDLGAQTVASVGVGRALVRGGIPSLQSFGGAASGGARVLVDSSAEPALGKGVVALATCLHDAPDGASRLAPQGDAGDRRQAENVKRRAGLVARKAGGEETPVRLAA